MIISTEELKKMIDVATGTASKDAAGPVDYVLIDVRREDELVNGMIPTANHLSMDEIGQAFELSEDDFLNRYGFPKPTKDELIIVHCRTGGRSNVVASKLNDKGYHVQNYEGSVQEWSKIDENVKMY